MDTVAEDIRLRMTTGEGLKVAPKEQAKVSRFADTRAMEAVDQEAMKAFFNKFDVNGDGSISFEEFVDMTIELTIAPLKKDIIDNDEKVQEQKFRMESMNMPA